MILLDIYSLRFIPLSERLKNSHPFLRQLTSLSIDLFDPKSIIVFGSRARGDHRPRSDIDIAFEDVKSEEGWAHFLTTLEESAETLLEFDLVRYEEVTSDFRKKIDQEGIVIYERPT